MKVSYITLSEIPRVKSHISAVVLALSAVTGLIACAGANVRRAEVEALHEPPIESIWLRLAPTVTDVPASLRQAMFNVGLQASAESRDEGWVRAPFGGVWDDAYNYRQWFIVAAYTADTVSPGVTVVLRALELHTSYITPLGRSGSPTGPRSPGFSNTKSVSNVTTGEGRAAWHQLEQLAFALEERGGELLTDLSTRSRRSVTRY